MPPPYIELDCLVLCCSLATVILQSSQCMCAHVVPKIAPDPCRNRLRNPPPLFCGRKWVLDRKHQNRNFRFCLPSVSQHVCICLISARKVSTSANSSASSPKMFARGSSATFSTAQWLNCGGGEPTRRRLWGHVKLILKDAGVPNKDDILLYVLAFKLVLKYTWSLEES